MIGWNEGVTNAISYIEENLDKELDIKDIADKAYVSAFYFQKIFHVFLSCAEAEKNLHTTPNSQRLIDNLAIDNPLMYAALALDCELQAWADAMDEDWSP